jgi:oligopeptide/dipeptide ABC transporter ATP-binding protein
MAPILNVKNLRVDYGITPAVRNISFEISPGEVLAVVGESGSGKSTIALTLMGLLDGTRRSGSSVLDVAECGRVDLLKASERTMCKIRGRIVSMIFQDPMPSLNPISRIDTQIAEMMSLHGKIPPNDVRRRSMELLEQTGIVDVERCLRSYPHQLSGGQCQRVGIAMALANKPSLIIADEPTTALDVTVQVQILRCLESLRRASDIAILFITHDLSLVSRFADRVLVMYAGEVVESGPVAQVFAQPRMPYTAALLSSRPRFDNAGNPIALDPIPGMFAGMDSIPTGCSFHPRCRYLNPAVCPSRHPELDHVAPEHLVRCVRWRELT